MWKETEVSTGSSDRGVGGVVARGELKFSRQATNGIPHYSCLPGLSLPKQEYCLEKHCTRRRGSLQRQVLVVWFCYQLYFHAFWVQNYSILISIIKGHRGLVSKESLILKNVGNSRHGHLGAEECQGEIITNPHLLTEELNAWGHRLRLDWKPPTETWKDTQLRNRLTQKRRKHTTLVSDTLVATSCQRHILI